jgi:hypothetical protein
LRAGAFRPANKLLEISTGKLVEICYFMRVRDSVAWPKGGACPRLTIKTSV